MTLSEELAGLVERLNLIAAWRKPGGPTPDRKKPNTYKAVTEAATTLTAQASEIAALKAELAEAREFIESIEDAWVNNDASDEDEWSDGYEDCLAEWAKKARAQLARKEG